MAKAKPNQKFQIDKLDRALEALDKLETKPKSELSLRESIYFLRGKLNAALKKGYSYDDLSSILAEQEILVSAATLKLYLTESSKSRKKKLSLSRSPKNQAAFSSKQSSVSSTSVANSTKKKEPANLNSKVNSIKSKEPNTTSEKTALIDKSRNEKKSKSKETKAKPRILSGLDDDLSGEFNQY
ncbi:MAG: hypothetical protein AAFQ80_23245 [Cyanobacteria bacterium J06621_8]